MQQALQITFREIERSEALETRIRDNVAKLEQFYPRMIGCHVTIEQVQKHQSQGKLFNVRIEANVPGGAVVATHDLSEDVYVAVREAFAAAQRQLEERIRRQRGDVKRHEPTFHQRQRLAENGGDEA